jgi:HK97 gp10 family phage protein
VTVHHALMDMLLRRTHGPIGAKLSSTGLRVQSTAKRLCPVDTGRLRSSIQTTNPRETGTGQVSIRVGSNVNYARFVELGTRYQRARPYLRPALEQEVR